MAAEANEALQTLSMVMMKEEVFPPELAIYQRMLLIWHRKGYPKKFTVPGAEIAGSENRSDMANARARVRSIEAKGLIVRKKIAYHNIGKTEYTIVRTKLPTTESEKEQHKEVLEYLNEKLHKRFSLKTKSYQKKIYARLREGYTVEQLKEVIDKKQKEWTGTEYSKYLNPDTLFSATHFDKYLNQDSSEPNQRSGGSRYI